MKGTDWGQLRDVQYRDYLRPASVSKRMEQCEWVHTTGRGNDTGWKSVPLLADLV